MAAFRREGAGGARLEVQDPGHAVAEPKREVIFEEACQLANANRDRAEGWGLGLAILRRLARVLGDASHTAMAAR
jgi:K+-sensing histidine kinase KdpD